MRLIIGLLACVLLTMEMDASRARRRTCTQRAALAIVAAAVYGLSVVTGVRALFGEGGREDTESCKKICGAVRVATRHNSQNNPQEYMCSLLDLACRESCLCVMKGVRQDDNMYWVSETNLIFTCRRSK